MSKAKSLAALVVNKLRGVLNVCAVKAPGFGDRRKAMLGDIAMLTGGTLISEDLGMKLENITLEAARPRQEDHRRQGQHHDRPRRRQAGRRLEADRPDSQGQIEAPTSDYDREKLQERLAKLTGGVAIISVGAETEADMKQKKARVEDALHATRAAVEEGILPGGGVALLRCNEAVEKARSGAKGDERIGVDIILGVLSAPLKQIADNCGIDGSVVADEVSQKSAEHRLRCQRRRVRRHGQGRHHRPDEGRARPPSRNAASIAGLMLTTEALVTNFDKDDNKKAVVGSIR